MRFGFCPVDQPEDTHRWCPYQVVASMGVREGQLEVCDCPCHAGRSPDLSVCPPGTVLASEADKIDRASARR